MLLEGLEGLLELGLRQPRLRGDLEEGLSPPPKDGGCKVLDLEWAKEAGDPPSGTVTVSKPPSETSSIALSQVCKVFLFFCVRSAFSKDF